MALTRFPPAAVRRQLRAEVGFGCPVPGCGSPYLEYHHFDPEWATEQHHRPEGMIALCKEHHGKAEAFLPEQLREMKCAGHDSEQVAGRFDWLRRELLGIVGGNYFYQQPCLLAVNHVRWIWFTRDEKGHALVNFWLCDRAGRIRVVLIENDWFVLEPPADLVCPPNGKSLSIRYADGDRLDIRFEEISKLKSPNKEDVERFASNRQIDGATTCVLVTGRMLDIAFDPSVLTVGTVGASMRGCFSSRNASAGMNLLTSCLAPEWWEGATAEFGSARFASR